MSSLLLSLLTARNESKRRLLRALVLANAVGDELVHEVAHDLGLGCDRDEPGLGYRPATVEGYEVSLNSASYA
jgi:hypothetical protein